MTKSAWLAVAFLTIFSQTGFAKEYSLNKEYTQIRQAHPTSSPEQIEVIEFFWYGCPHCFKLEPYVQRWLETKPKDVKFVRIPGILNKTWAIHARAYYTAEILGVVDKTHEAMFEAIHVKNQPLDTERAIKDLYVKQGVSPKDFDRTFRSFAIESKVRRASNLMARMGINGVPGLVINGKYRTDASKAGGNKNIFKVVDYVVEQERQAKK